MKETKANSLLLVLPTPGISRMHVLHLIQNSVDVAFIHSEFRQGLLRKMEEQVFQACLNFKV